MNSSSRTGPARTFVLGTMALAAVAIGAGWSGAPDVRFWFWLGACALGELLCVRLPVGGATVSMALACNFAAMLLLPPGHAMLAIAASTLLVESIVMRKPAMRFVFNAAQSALAAGCGIVVMALASGGAMPPLQSLEVQHLIPVAMAALTYAAVNTGSVSAVIALYERRDIVDVWRTNFGTVRTMLSSLAHFSLGSLLAAIYVFAGPEGAMLVALPLFVIHACCVIVMLRSGAPRPSAPADEDRRAA